MTLCKNCGREIRTRVTLVGYEHTDTGFVLCSHTVAEPEEEKKP